ncbi:hypothetical protein [Brevibacillus brevis]|uniref:hypothetical protein n=1 Tax=Brevibacillus brevis TaxID=1393 RepID=UPI0007D8B910|nr:hypothetical protein [Brevibacillus brevis]
MQTYIVNNLAIKAEQMNQDFTLENENGTFNGRKGDYIIHTKGKQRGLSKLEFEQTYQKVEDWESAKDKFRQMMAQGYQEMGSINLGIANEDVHLEVEAARIREQYINKHSK